MLAEGAAAIILAGGKSARFGRDKASEVFAGRTLLQRAIDACEGLATRLVIVSAQAQALPEVESRAPITIVEDAFRESGPLGAIYTGLESLVAASASQQGPRRHQGREGTGVASHALVVACDMPLLQGGLLRELLENLEDRDAVVPLRNGVPEPLCAVYSTTCIEPARRLLERGDYRVTGLLKQVDTLMLAEEHWRGADPKGLSFLNVNRQEDLAEALALLDSSAC